MRIGLLLESLDTAGTEVDDQAYTVNGVVVPAAGDKRRRRVFENTILMRNLASP